MSVIRAVITPGARKERIQQAPEGGFTISVREEAVGNKANERVRELLALHFHLPKTQVRLLSGARSPHKRFSIITT